MSYNILLDPDMLINFIITSLFLPLPPFVREWRDHMNFHEETAGARLRTWYTDREIRESRVIFTSKVKVPL